MRSLSARLTNLQELVLIFSNPAQQLETRHLASLAALPALASLTLQASFHPESCNFSAALGPCSALSKFVVLPHEASKGLTDSHVASLAGVRSLCWGTSSDQNGKFGLSSLRMQAAGTWT
jgi:hypothetical protein